MIWSGRVEDGKGNASRLQPFPEGWYQGSLNLRGDYSLTGRLIDGRPRSWQRVRWMPVIVPAQMHTDNGPLNVIIGIDPTTDLTEVVATIRLRDQYSLSNGDLVTLSIDDRFVVEGETDVTSRSTAARRKPRAKKPTQKTV